VNVVMQREWLLQRSCSMTPRRSAKVHGALGAGMALVSGVFALRGFWFVSVFAALEMAGVAIAVRHWARHAGDRERIALSDDCLLIERVEAGCVRRLRLDPCWTRIAPPTRRRHLIGLESRGLKVELGSFVSEPVRHRVAGELSHALRSTSYLA
jgi:uncharacterized membrane protein